MTEEVIEIDNFVPDYKGHCIICGQSPTVLAEKDGKIIYDSEMCGPCTWGEATCLDPEEWNK